MKKHIKKAPIYLVFQDTPRIYRVKEQIPPGLTYIVNPDLSRVRGIPMSSWTVDLFVTKEAKEGFWTELRIAAVVSAALLSITAIALGVLWVL